MAELYPFIKAFHLVAVISWMATLFYVPRLFVYHADVKTGSAEDSLFKIMERNAMRRMMNPTMIATLILGFAMIYISGMAAFNYWIHAKLGLVFLLLGYHGMVSKYRKAFASGRNTKSSLYFRVFNEVPVIIMTLIVLLVIVRPF